MNGFWATITQFGDSGLLLPLGAAFTLGLWAGVSRQVAWHFASAFVLCAVALAGFKLLFLAWGHQWYGRLESPSGHAGLSVMVYGGMGVVALHELRTPAARGWHWLLLPAILAGAALSTAIAASRKLLGAHSVAEVLAGCALGAACLALFHLRYPGGTGRPARLVAVYAAMAALAALLLGTNFSPEARLGRAAQQLRLQMPAR